MNVKQFLIMLAVTAIMIPISAVRPMTSLFATDLGASEAQIGLLTACFSLAPLFLAVFAGRFIDHFGEKLPVLVGSAALAVALIAIYALPYLGTVYVAQLLLGGAQLLTFVALQNRVASSVPPEERNQAVASFSLYASIGSMVGPLLGGYATEHFGFTLSYLLFSIFALYPLLISVLLIPSARREDDENSKSHSLKQLFGIQGLTQAIVISMLILAALDIFYVYFPLYASSIGLTPSAIPILFAGLVHITGVGAILAIKGALLAAGSFLSKTLPE